MKVDKADIKNQIVILKAMLNQVRYNNPKFKLFNQHQIGVKRIKSNIDDINIEIIRRLRIQNKKLMTNIATLKSQLKNCKSDSGVTKKQLHVLQKLNNSLSRGLGSCPKCWGDDPHCENCAGNGAPGWQKINKKLFNIYVLPALEKLYGLPGKIK